MKWKVFFLIFLALTFFNTQNFAQETGTIKKIVIDAGHGGEDPGALGKRVREKDINLAVALQLGALIKEQYPDISVLYTRKTDVAVDLYKRARLANENHADLFISIHCNSSENKAAHGVETFVMGLHKSEASLEVAKKENAAILKEKNYENNYEGFNPNSPEANVIFSLYTSAYLKNSAILASKVQKNLVQNTHFTDRKVQQAGFWVLYKVAMPSILIELGFVSNYDEESALMQKSTKEKMVKSIFNAFVEYKNLLDNENKPLLKIDVQDEPKPAEVTPPTTPQVADNQKDTVQNKVEKVEVAEAQNDGIIYKVQVYASPEELKTSDPKFKPLSKVAVYTENGFWKYTVGSETSFKAAKQLQQEVRAKGFADAFVIVFKEGKKLASKEAAPYLK